MTPQSTDSQDPAKMFLFGLVCFLQIYPEQRRNWHTKTPEGARDHWLQEKTWKKNNWMLRAAGKKGPIIGQTDQ